MIFWRWSPSSRSSTETRTPCSTTTASSSDLMNPAFRGLTCFACELAHDPAELAGVCRACGMPLRVDYDFARIKLDPAALAGRVSSLFRYREVLPVAEGEDVTLVEGWTPLIPVSDNLWVKDEARNPTGS